MGAEGTQRFPGSSPGYDPAAVDRVLGDAEAERRDLEARIEELSRERDELDRELARVRGELDATRAAIPEIGELRQRLERMEAEYHDRVAALERLVVSVAREAAGAGGGTSTRTTTSSSPPARGSFVAPDPPEGPEDAD